MLECQLNTRLAWSKANQLGQSRKEFKHKMGMPESYERKVPTSTDIPESYERKATTSTDIPTTSLSMESRIAYAQRRRTPNTPKVHMTPQEICISCHVRETKVWPHYMRWKQAMWGHKHWRCPIKINDLKDPRPYPPHECPYRVELIMMIDSGLPHPKECI